MGPDWSCCDLDLQGSDPNFRRNMSSQYGDHFREIVLKSDLNNEVMGGTRIRDVWMDRQTTGLYAPPNFVREHKKLLLAFP